MSRKLLQRALDALEESLDLVRQEYEADWRHGLNSRQAEMDAIRAKVEEHKSVIHDLREELGRPGPEPIAYKVFRSDINRWVLRHHEANGLVCVPLFEKIYEEPAKPPPAPPDLDAIKAEADKFIEWPTADRTAVLTTTAILFARHCAEKTANGTWP
jgi:hypothetical protein